MKKKVLIIGGGFGGVFTAKHLHRLAGETLQLELISERNYFVFQPLLPEVAAGILNAQDAVTPLRLLLPGIRVRLAEAKSINFEKRIVQVVQGRKKVLIPIHYDHLVIATGQVTDLSRFPGFPQHSLTMKDLADAHTLRNHIINCLELADITENPQLKSYALSFVVVGAGFSGVETMGEIMEMIQRTLRFYPRLCPEDVRAIMVQRDNKILPELPPSLGEYAAKILRKRGIDIRLETGVASASDTALRTDQGERIEAMTVVTTMGNGPSPFLRRLPLTLERGRIPTDRYLKVQQEDKPDVWAVGDIALVPMEDGSYAPPTAQFAVREARTLAKNILATATGKEPLPFRYQPKGSLASLGKYKGVAQVFGVNLSGLSAWLFWRAVYLAMLPSFSTRLRITLNWFFDYFMPRNTVQTQQAGRPACRQVHYAKDEIVCAQDQLLEGFYIVVSGALEMRIPEQSGGEDFVKRYAPGDHWGERIIEADCLSTGAVTALEDSVVLIVRRDDFERLRDAFPPLRGYFEGIDESRYSPGVRKLTEQAAEES